MKKKENDQNQQRRRCKRGRIIKITNAENEKEKHGQNHKGDVKKKNRDKI
jgi:hypothetical protein